jgi:peptidoglycan/LPS O-acetylase OafA/YrhL
VIIFGTYPSNRADCTLPLVEEAASGTVQTLVIAREPATRLSDQPARSQEYIPSLDGLRAIAVIAVIAFHFGASIDGAAGVTVFFALSGFLITDLLLKEWSHRGRISLGHFYRRRIRRLLPASTFAVIATIAVVEIKHLPSIGRQAQAALTYWTNWERFGSHVAYGQPTFAPLTHFWSLAVEEQFYFAFPLLALLALRFGRRFFAAICAFAFIGSALWAHSLVGNPSAYYHTGARACELLAGALLACVAWRLPTWVGHLALAVLVATMVFATAPHLLIALMTLVVIAGRPTFLAAQPLPAIGKVSYGLYLFHPIALIIAEGSVAVAIPIMLAFTVASYFLLESPVRFRMSWPRARAVILTMSAAALTLALVMAPRPKHQPFVLVADSAAPVVAAVASTPMAGVPTAVPPATSVAIAVEAFKPAHASAVPGAPDEKAAVVPATVPRPTIPAPTTAVPVPTSTALPPPPIRISMAGDSTSQAIGQALVAWADIDPTYEFVPAPPSANGWADWPQWGLGRASCGLMHSTARSAGVEIIADDPGNRDNVDDAEHVGCDSYTWIEPALATMDLNVLVVSWVPTQMTDFLVDGVWLQPGTDAYHQEFLRQMDYFEAMAASYGTKVLWIAYPDVIDDPDHYLDFVDDDTASRAWWIDLRPMSRDADPTPLYYDQHHFTPEAAAQAVAVIVPVLAAGPSVRPPMG